jgi:hypothetical protein
MGEEKTARITHVDLDGTRGADGKADVVLMVYLSNGQSVGFSLNGKGRDPRFADIVAGKNRAGPKTDGVCVYWPDGPRLSLDEIMGMVVE